MLRKSKIAPIVLLSLVLIGLTSQLYNDPIGLLKSVVMVAIFAGALYFLFTRYLPQMSQSSSSSADSRYEKALKQQKSRQKGKEPNPVSTEKKTTRPTKSKVRRDHPFTVIEGRKGKADEKTKTS